MLIFKEGGTRTIVITGLGSVSTYHQTGDDIYKFIAVLVPGAVVHTIVDLQLFKYLIHLHHVLYAPLQRERLGTEIRCPHDVIP